MNIELNGDDTNYITAYECACVLHRLTKWDKYLVVRSGVEIIIELAVGSWLRHWLYIVVFHQYNLPLFCVALPMMFFCALYLKVVRQ
jgi:hypothetical protein